MKLTRLFRPNPVPGWCPLKRILIADDDAANLELACEILANHGFAVAPARDGREVLDMIHSVQPDILLLDIQMPRMGGFEVVTCLRQNRSFSSLPIIAASASAMSGDKEVALSCGFNAFIEKPFESQALVELVNRFLSQIEEETA